MNKKKIYLYLVVFMFFLSITLFSSTFARYVSDVEVGGNVEVGELFVGYENGDLYRNDILIMGVTINEDGHTVIETKDIKPGDKISYEFIISNIVYELDENNKLINYEYNSVDASYMIDLKAQIHLPAYNGGTIVDVNCQLAEIIDPSTGATSAVDTSQPRPLRCYNPNEDGTLNETSVDNTKYRIEVDDTKQLTNLTSKHYFGATLNIYITITSVQNLPQIKIS